VVSRPQIVPKVKARAEEKKRSPPEADELFNLRRPAALRFGARWDFDTTSSNFVNQDIEQEAGA
jgi:hypothetical protein